VSDRMIWLSFWSTASRTALMPGMARLFRSLGGRVNSGRKIRDRVGGYPSYRPSRPRAFLTPERAFLWAFEIELELDS
jgi:hypothetical protein